MPVMGLKLGLATALTTSPNRVDLTLNRTFLEIDRLVAHSFFCLCRNALSVRRQLCSLI